MNSISARFLLLLAIAVFLAPVADAQQTLAPAFAGESVNALGGTDCDDGVVLDDGSLESGYGWVPSAVDGRFVQRFEAADFRSRKMEEVCICWTRTQGDDEVRFSVELYRDRGGRPALSPEASVEAVATMVPTFPDGAFYSVDVSDADMHAATDVFYLGVRWNPSDDVFFFVCVDQSEETPVVDGWFIDDRADEWGSVLESNDPIFDDHRAMMIRARAVEGYFPLVPTLGTWGLVILIGAICAVGILVLRRGETRVTKFPFWLKAVLLTIPAVLLMVFLVLIAIGWYVKSQMNDSGGELRPLMAAYDVRHYALDVEVDVADRSIRGVNRVTVQTLAAVGEFEIHLDDRLEVESVAVDGEPADFDHDDGLVLTELPIPWRPGDRHVVTIRYRGQPKVALRPPWIDGFVWSETLSGEPWIGVTGEADGGDNWWPCKDHPSDEPDEGMEIELTVPEGLVGLTNGRFLGETVNPDGTVTSSWRVGFPINNYCVTVNIGPYEPVAIAYDGNRRGSERASRFLGPPRSRRRCPRDVAADAPGSDRPRQEVRRVSVLCRQVLSRPGPVSRDGAPDPCRLRQRVRGQRLRF